MSINTKIKPSILNSTVFAMLLGLLFLTFCTPADGAIKGHKKKKKTATYSLTVAAIRSANDEEAFMRVTFLQSARFYKLPKDANPGYLQLLKESELNHSPVIVERATEESDIIVSVKKVKQ